MKTSTAETLTFIGLGILATVAVFGCVAVMMLIPVLLLMWAWNEVMPALFGLPQITFWMAVALAIILSFVRSTVSIVNNARRRAARDDE